MQWFLKCLKEYANFSGRARRREYWFFALFNCITSGVILFIASVLGNTLGMPIIGIVVSWLYSLAVLLPSIAVTVRRLHDTNKSGLYLFWVLVPLVGAILILIAELKEGDLAPNRFGDLAPREAVNV